MRIVVVVLLMLGALGATLAHLKRYDEALEVLQQASELWKDAPVDESHAYLESMNVLGYAALEAKRAELAERTYKVMRERGEALGAEDQDRGYWIAVGSLGVGHALIQQNRWREAEAALLHGVDHASRNPFIEAECHLQLGNAALEAGRLEQARTRANQALALWDAEKHEDAGQGSGADGAGGGGGAGGCLTDLDVVQRG